MLPGTCPRTMTAGTSSTARHSRTPAASVVCARASLGRRCAGLSLTVGERARYVRTRPSCSPATGHGKAASFGQLKPARAQRDSNSSVSRGTFSSTLPRSRSGVELRRRAFVTSAAPLAVRPRLRRAGRGGEPSPRRAHGRRVTKERLEEALLLGTLAWNAGALGCASVRACLSAHGGGGLLDAIGPIEGLLDQLFTRRMQLFGADRRVVGSFEVVEGAPGDYRLAVAWARPGHGPHLPLIHRLTRTTRRTGRSPR